MDIWLKWGSIPYHIASFIPSQPIISISHFLIYRRLSENRKRVMVVHLFSCIQPLFTKLKKIKLFPYSIFCLLYWIVNEFKIWIHSPSNWMRRWTGKENAGLNELWNKGKSTMKRCSGTGLILFPMSGIHHSNHFWRDVLFYYIAFHQIFPL